MRGGKSRAMAAPNLEIGEAPQVGDRGCTDIERLEAAIARQRKYLGWLETDLEQARARRKEAN